MFFCDEDRQFYLCMLRQCAERFALEIWAYCLMSNHIHLIARPHDPRAMSQGLGLAHQRCASATNARHGWTSNLWANRFYASALDLPHLWLAVHDVELKPGRAGLVDTPAQWPWSSARHHAGLCTAPVLHTSAPFPGPEEPWTHYLARGLTAEQLTRLRANTRTRRPTGSQEFMAQPEAQTGRLLRPAKRGRKPRGTISQAPVDEHDLFR